MGYRQIESVLCLCHVGPRDCSEFIRPVSKYLNHLSLLTAQETYILEQICSCDLFLRVLSVCSHMCMSVPGSVCVHAPLLVYKLQGRRLYYCPSFVGDLGIQTLLPCLHSR